MSVHTLSAKLLILLFAIVHFAAENEKMPGAVLYGVLGFVFVHALSATLPKRSTRVALCLLGCTSAIWARSDFPEAQWLLPITLYDMMLLLTGKWTALAAAGLSAILPLDAVFAPIALMVLFSYVIIHDAIRLLEEDRLKLRGQNDILRIRADELSKRLAHDQEYRRQLTQNTQLEERNRIAQEIHDRVGHTLSGSLMQLEAARLMLGKDPIKTDSMLSGVIANLRSGLESIRQTLRNIKPGTTQLGINRVRLTLDDFTARFNIKTALESAGDLSYISQPMWRIIQENLSEALTNTVRHGTANEVRVWIRILNKLVRVEIRDDGQGCKAVHKGMGLMGMEERLSAVDGRLIADGSDGFSLIMLIPYTAKKPTAETAEEQRSTDGDQTTDNR